MQLLEALMQVEWGAANEEGLFEILNNKFRLQYNETIKLLQFCKLVRQHMKVQKSGWTG